MKNIFFLFCVFFIACSNQKPLNIEDKINNDISKNPTASGGSFYYVDPVQGSMDNPGTKELPWSTFAEVIEYDLIEAKERDGFVRNEGAPVKVGDSIVLMSGYHGHVVIAGYFNEGLIYVQAAEGEHPEFGSLAMYASNNWSFSGLEISQSIAGGSGSNNNGIVSMDWDVSNITIKDSYVFSIRDSSFWSSDDWSAQAYNGVFVGSHGTSNITIENVFFHNVKSGINSAAINTLVRGSVIVNYAHEAIKLRANNAVVEDNIIRNSIWGAGAIRIDSLEKSAENIAISNNIILDNEDKENLNYSIGIVSYNDKLTNFQVLNNLIITKAVNGMILNSLNASNVVGNIVVGTADDGINAAISMWKPINTTIIDNSAQKIKITGAKYDKQVNPIMSPLPELYNKILVSELEIKVREMAVSSSLLSKESGVQKLDVLAMGLPFSESFTNWYSDKLTAENAPVIIVEDEVIIKELNTVTTNSLTQYGVTWAFSEEVEYGQFVTGDYYVVDNNGFGVTVVSVSPLSEGGENGSMINPVPGAGQGFTASGYDYKPELTVNFPIELHAGDALLSSISKDGTESLNWAGKTISSQSRIKTVAVLTVLSKHPPSGTFRPSYSDRSQTLYNINQIDLSVLPNKPITATSPSLGYLERGMERPWVLLGDDWKSRSVHPLENMFNYHQNIGEFLSEVTLLLTTDLPNKELLINRFIQVGIDYYYNPSDSSAWAWPLVFTGLLLNEPDMYNFWINNPEIRRARGHEKLYYPENVVEATKSAIIPVDQTWVDWASPSGKYVAFRKQVGQEYEHLHPSEWVCLAPDCKAEIYRSQHDIHPLIGLTLSSILVDSQVPADVNAMLAHDPIRDYADRWMSNIFKTGIYGASSKTYIQEVQDNTDFTVWYYMQGSGGSKFIDEMWGAYR